MPPLTKEALRQEILSRKQAGDLPDAGRTAERIRKLTAYRKALCVLCSPARELQQVRLNTLADGKKLLLPTPFLQKGFLFLDPRGISPSKRLKAVQPHPGNPFAARPPYHKPLAPPVDLIVSDAVAAARDGSLLGDGRGHLDLQVAALRELRWLHPGVQIVVVLGDDSVLEALPVEAYDVRAHWIVTPSAAVRTSCSEPPDATILWERLDRKTVRRNDVLFHLRGRSIDKGT